MDKTARIKALALFTPDELRFWSNVTIGDGCWEWHAAIGHDGYGYCSFRGKTIQAHRLALRFQTGEILGTHNIIRHLCNNRLCVNPDHLQVGTQAENVQDTMKSGRHKAGGPFTKLRPDQHDEIRQRYRLGGVTQIELARQFGVSLRHITSICSNARQS